MKLPKTKEIYIAAWLLNSMDQMEGFQWKLNLNMLWTAKYKYFSLLLEFIES